MKISPNRRKTQITGEVFTRHEVVEYMIGTVKKIGNIKNWVHIRTLEPSCGRGAFVLPIVDKIISETKDWHDVALKKALVACDISEENIEYVSGIVLKRLTDAGCPEEIAKQLVAVWFVCDDFLMHDFTAHFDVVIGNPPYIRFDNLSSAQQIEYRRRYKTFSNRCDIYIPFFEKSLSLLARSGIMSFICTNRFTRNRYGRKLREFISDKFHVAMYLNMEHTSPFLEEVSAYPAIFVIDKRIGAPTISASIDSADADMLNRMDVANGAKAFSRFDRWYRDGEIWTSTCADDRIEAVRVENIYPTIENSAFGTRIGIGVASGADDIFVDAQRHADIEAERLVPLVVSEDIKNGSISWGQHYILNPYDFHGDSEMIDLAKFPKTAAYFKNNENRLKARYCARGNGEDWFRTLDKMNHKVFKSAKLLLPDIQSGGNVALDEYGEFYPHHNVYWITSAIWNLKALCVILRSSFVTDQIRRVSVQMRGGSIRYQAQNLRNVHIPAWESITTEDVMELERLYDNSDREYVNSIVLSIVERSASRQPRRLVQDMLF